MIHDFVVNVVELTANWLLACKGAKSTAFMVQALSLGNLITS